MEKVKKVPQAAIVTPEISAKKPKLDQEKSGLYCILYTRIPIIGIIWSVFHI